jgi:hypothetical protein
MATLFHHSNTNNDNVRVTTIIKHGLDVDLCLILTRTPFADGGKKLRLVGVYFFE